MLRISKLTDYATVILSYMAKNYHDRHTAKEIADATGVHLPTVSKLLKVLQKAHVLSSARGAKGGYFLARDPNRISVAEIIAAVEGPIALTECSLSVTQCRQSDGCQIRANWGVINKAVKTALDSITLADMIKPASDPPQIRIPLTHILTQ